MRLVPVKPVFIAICDVKSGKPRKSNMTKRKYEVATLISGLNSHYTSNCGEI
jgi:hypothetical protein